MSTPTFTLEALLDLAQHEARVSYENGYRDGLAAADQHHATEWAEQRADDLDTVTHAQAVASLLGAAEAFYSRNFTALGIDPVTADSDTLRQAAEFLRWQEAERVREYVAAVSGSREVVAC